MKELITNLPNEPVFVRTTILPGTSEKLSRETGHQVCYMPESAHSSMTSTSRP